MPIIKAYHEIILLIRVNILIIWTSVDNMFCKNSTQYIKDKMYYTAITSYMISTRSPWHTTLTLIDLAAGIVSVCHLLTLS
jgi:hypothetical protein